MYFNQKHKRLIRLFSYSIFFLMPSLSRAELNSTSSECDALSKFNFPAAMKLQISDTQVNQTENFCLVHGVVGPRKGIDGKNYAIHFEMRLPLNWNGKFLYQMNGGNDGNVVPAEGDSGLNAFGGKSARARSYAVLSTDAGHSGNDPENQSFGLAGSNRFGLDPEARENYGYKTTAIMTPIAKEILRAFYKKAPEYSYLAGCSNGGRHGMVAASRYGDMFNGILVGAPGFDLPKAALQHAWDIQSTQQADPDIHKAFSRADMSLITQQLLKQCDQLDGAADGLINNIRQCQREFKIEKLRCAKDQTTQCLTEKQILAFKHIMAGPSNSKGEKLYTHWWYDSGISDEGWRFWKFESPIPFWDNNPLIATMGAGALAYVFTTPATQVEGSPAKLLQYLSEFNFDKDAPKIFAKDGSFTESAMEFMTPPDIEKPLLQKFQQSGGKLIIYQGQSDPVFSTVDIVNWYEKLNKNNRGKAQNFARLFVVPGMNHCAGGPATDQFDAFDALVQWVEHGIAPNTIAASVGEKNSSVPKTWSPKRTRNLCAWPSISTYAKGDIESADSFVCRAP